MRVEQNSMVFLNFLPEVIPGHYNFGINRQEILREIYLCINLNEPFSADLEIFDFSQKNLYGGGFAILRLR